MCVPYQKICGFSLDSTIYDMMRYNVWSSILFIHSWFLCSRRKLLFFWKGKGKVLWQVRPSKLPVGTDYHLFRERSSFSDPGGWE